MSGAPTPPGQVLTDALLQRVLAPYATNARYVHGAMMTQSGNGNSPRVAVPATHLRIDAECGFAAPCYIASTGHFNAVECNITYNQLLYLTIAESVQRRLLPELRHWSLDDFFVHQLPDVLIADYHARFRRPMTSRQYRGWFSIVDVQQKPARNMLLLQTRAGCHNDDGGECSIDATIALVNWRPT